ncbi:phosphatidylglycerophosphatase A [soil metagenome]
MPRPPLRMITTFGLGALRPAPGTWGSLPPCVLAAALAFTPIGVGQGSSQAAWVFVNVMLAVAAVFSWACIADGERAEARFGAKDPSNVVADETAGMALTLCALPWTRMARVDEFFVRTLGVSAPTAHVLSMLALIGLAFVLFRLMDIFKPWPANALQRVPGGWGILLDDLVAGVYAAAMMLSTAYFAR